MATLELILELWLVPAAFVAMVSFAFLRKIAPKLALWFSLIFGLGWPYALFCLVRDVLLGRDPWD